MEKGPFVYDQNFIGVWAGVVDGVEVLVKDV